MVPMMHVSAQMVRFKILLKTLVDVQLVKYGRVMKEAQMEHVLDQLNAR